MPKTPHISSTRFHWNGLIGVAEISELNDVYSHETEFWVQSSKTGSLERFIFSGADRNQDNETTGWRFETPSHQFQILIIND